MLRAIRLLAFFAACSPMLTAFAFVREMRKARAILLSFKGVMFIICLSDDGQRTNDIQGSSWRDLRNVHAEWLRRSAAIL